jgi:hypothetical protein
VGELRLAVEGPLRRQGEEVRELRLAVEGREREGRGDGRGGGGREGKEGRGRGGHELRARRDAMAARASRGVAWPMNTSPMARQNLNPMVAAAQHQSQSPSGAGCARSTCPSTSTNTVFFAT